jgi:hypothetical protein
MRAAWIVTVLEPAGARDEYWAEAIDDPANAIPAAAIDRVLIDRVGRGRSSQHVGFVVCRVTAAPGLPVRPTTTELERFASARSPRRINI